MQILQDYWTKGTIEDEVKEVYKYVVNLKGRLEDTCKLAQQELQKAKETKKRYYDRHSKPKVLKVGSKVLLLLLTKSNKLLLQWRSPYRVVKKVSALNYIRSKLETK